MKPHDDQSTPSTADWVKTTPSRLSWPTVVTSILLGAFAILLAILILDDNTNKALGSLVEGLTGTLATSGAVGVITGVAASLVVTQLVGRNAEIQEYEIWRQSTCDGRVEFQQFAKACLVALASEYLAPGAANQVKSELTDESFIGPENSIKLTTAGLDVAGPSDHRPQVNDRAEPTLCERFTSQSCASVRSPAEVVPLYLLTRLYECGQSTWSAAQGGGLKSSLSKLVALLGEWTSAPPPSAITKQLPPQVLQLVKILSDINDSHPDDPPLYL